MPSSGTIFDVKRFAVHDGPGIRTTLFLKGCPMECHWCHNPEGIDTGSELFFHDERCINCGSCVELCETKALSRKDNMIHMERKRCTRCGKCAELCPTEALKMAGETITERQAIDIIKRDELYYETSRGGVTFSGGEPLMQHEFLKELVKNCKREGIHVALDTSGHIEPGIFRKLMEDIDLFLYDLKMIDDENHRRYTGVSNRYVLKNLKTLSETDKEVWIRFPVIPDITCTDSNIEGIISFLSELKNMNKIFLLPFHDVGEKYAKLGKDYLMKDTKAPSRDRMDELRKKFVSRGFVVKEGG